MRIPIQLRRLTAVEPARPVDLTRVAVADSTADARGVAPHHLREVTPGVIVVRVVIRVLHLLFVPAMNGGTGELDPLIVFGGSWLLRGEVATGAHLRVLAKLLDVV